MRSPLKLLSILVVAAIALPSSTVAQTRAHQKKTTASKTASPPDASATYDSKPFDTSAAKLPVGYRGNSFRKMYETVVLVPPKGEFETTAEYEQRSHHAVTGLYAFLLPTAKSTYDADNETMSVRIETAVFHPGLGVEQEAGYLVDQRRVSERKYPASNAFGAHVIVTESNLATSGVLPKVGPLSGGATFEIKVARADAQRLKHDLQALAVVKFADEQKPPFGEGPANGFSFVEAKIDSPSAINDMEFLLRADVIDLWVFDRSTGDVLAKHSDRSDHNKMQLSVYDPDKDGYAIVSVVGNKNLTLTRGFTKYGGGCHIVVGGHYEVVGMKAGAWGTGISMVDLGGKRSVTVTSADGSVLFDRKSPNSYGMSTNPEWSSAEEAARAMWQAAPTGLVRVKGDEYSSFDTNASLAGFRELWEWGVTNCGFPKFENR